MRLHVGLSLSAVVFSLAQRLAFGKGSTLNLDKFTLTPDDGIGNSINRRLTIASTSEFEVSLFFDLQYVSEETANQIETKNMNYHAVSHFCNSVKSQIMGGIVAGIASEMDSSVSVGEGNDHCNIVETSRVYDVEAENIFGIGYTSLQIQISQHVNVTSNQSLSVETVTFILEEGFEVRTGGQSQFRVRLQESASFDSVLIVELKHGLASPQELPSPKPTSYPTGIPTIEPTRLPTSAPTQWPSLTPTKKHSNVPSQGPTLIPSKGPSVNPTVPASQYPSRYLSVIPTQGSSTHPSITETSLPTKEPSPPNRSNVPTSRPAQVGPNNQLVDAPRSQTKSGAGVNNSVQRETIIIAAVAGGMATICVSCLFMTCLWWRQNRAKTTRRTPPKEALTARDGQGNHDPKNYIPGIVELDQQSLADTTLGEQTAGRGRANLKKRPTQAIQPLDSFDEQSLYTTPFSVKHDEASSYLPGISPTTSALSDQIIKPLDYEGNMLLPFSDTNTESSDGIYSSEPTSDRSQAFSGEGPTDLDTQKSYGMAKGKRGSPIVDSEKTYKQRSGTVSTPTNNETKARRISEDLEAGDLDLDPYGADEWSCDFEDFDRGSEYYADEARSRSPSQSSKSTSRIGNISSVLGYPAVPDEESQFSSWSGEEKKDVEKEMFEEQESFAKVHFDGLQRTGQKHRFGGEPPTTEEVDKNAAKLYLKLMMDNKIPEKTSSPTSAGSKKSLASKKSAASYRSSGTRKSPLGQPPLYPSIDSRLGPSHNFKSAADDTESSFFPVTLSKLFNAVANPDMKCTGPNIAQSIQSTYEEEEKSITTKTRKKPDDSEDGVNGLVGTRVGDDVSASSASTGMSPNPWLFDTVEQTLGPRSVTADMESLSGKSNFSVLSPGKRSMIGSESVTSYGSRISYKSRLAHSDVSMAPRTLEHDLKRLEMQLAALDRDNQTTTPTSACASSVTGASLSTVSTRNRSARVSRKKRIVVLVPPGKLGVILANRHDGRGTVVSEIREHSALRGMLSPGDKLVAVDGEDVTSMVVSQITSLMASKAERERRLTVITSVSQQYSKVPELKE